jgi:hypothetical protein
MCSALFQFDDERLLKHKSTCRLKDSLISEAENYHPPNQPTKQV